MKDTTWFQTAAQKQTLYASQSSQATPSAHFALHALPVIAWYTLAIQPATPTAHKYSWATLSAPPAHQDSLQVSMDPDNVQAALLAPLPTSQAPPHAVHAHLATFPPHTTVQPAKPARLDMLPLSNK